MDNRAERNCFLEKGAAAFCSVDFELGSTKPAGAPDRLDFSLWKGVRSITNAPTADLQSTWDLKRKNLDAFRKEPDMNKSRQLFARSTRSADAFGFESSRRDKESSVAGQ